jgi:hypothetical protein
MPGTSHVACDVNEMQRTYPHLGYSEPHARMPRARVQEAPEQHNRRIVLPLSRAAIPLHPPLAHEHALRSEARVEVLFRVHVLQSEDNLLHDAPRCCFCEGVEVPCGLACHLDTAVWRGT